MGGISKGGMEVFKMAKGEYDKNNANNERMASGAMKSNEGSVVGMNKSVGNALAGGVSSGILQSITKEKAQKDDDVEIT